MTPYSIRWAVEDDFTRLGEVMFDAVRNGPSLYDEGQRAAWVPVPRSGPAWSDRLGSQAVVLAELNGETVGFMSLAAGGYIDFAYIRPAARGAGLFRILFQTLEGRSRAEGQDRLWVHASLMARPAFAALGFRVVKPERVSIGSIEFDRFEMERTA